MGVHQPGSGGGGGGSQPGTTIVRHFPFAYNTPGILTGASLYTPTVGDILLDAWVEIDTTWNGTTPFGDLGTFVDRAFGIFKAFGLGPLDMTVSDSQIDAGDPSILSGFQVSDLAQNTTMNTATGALAVSGATIAIAAGNAVTFGSRAVPAKFTGAAPLKFCVSQDGTNTGANPGATQGAGVLYLVTATPA